MKLYEYIYSLRQQHDMSQVDFAKKIFVSKSYLCDIEMDRRAISVNKAITIAKRLDLCPIQFIQMILQDHLQRAGLDYEINLRSKNGTGIPSMAEDTKMAQ